MQSPITRRIQAYCKLATVNFFGNPENKQADEKIRGRTKLRLPRPPTTPTEKKDTIEFSSFWSPRGIAQLAILRYLIPPILVTSIRDASHLKDLVETRRMSPISGKSDQY